MLNLHWSSASLTMVEVALVLPLRHLCFLPSWRVGRRLSSKELTVMLDISRVKESEDGKFRRVWETAGETRFSVFLARGSKSLNPCL